MCFLLKHKMEWKANQVEKMTPVPLQMPWRNNVPDCGVYAMRHLETYMGKKDWKCDIKKGDEKQCDNMRHKYAASILGDQENTLRQENIKEASEAARKRA